MGGGEDAFDVGVNHLSPFLVGLNWGVAEEHDACAVDNEIGRAMDGFGFMDGGRDRWEVGDIDRARQGMWKVEIEHGLEAP